MHLDLIVNLNRPEYYGQLCKLKSLQLESYTAAVLQKIIASNEIHVLRFN